MLPDVEDFEDAYFTHAFVYLGLLGFHYAVVDRYEEIFGDVIHSSNYSLGAILTVACYDIVSPPPIVFCKPYTRKGGLDGIVIVLCSESDSSVFLADTGGQSFVTCGTRANHTFSASE